MHTIHFNQQFYLEIYLPPRLLRATIAIDFVFMTFEIESTIWQEILLHILNSPSSAVPIAFDSTAGWLAATILQVWNTKSAENRI